MKVQILENIYHSSENLVNIRLHQRLRELHWIKELSTVAPYDCNDQIKGVGTLSSPLCKHTNVPGIFNKQQRRKKSHGHRHYNKKTPQLDLSIDTFINLLDLTLFDMGEGHDAPPPQKKNVIDHCTQKLRRRKVKLGDF